MNWSRAKVSTIIKSLAAAPNASWVIARSTSGKCYPKPQAFPLERASPRVVVPRSPRLSSRPAEVTKQAAVSGVAAGDDAGGVAKATAVVVAGGGDEAGGVAKTAAVLVSAGGGDEAGRGAEVATALFAGFAFVRAAGGFMAVGANGSSSAMTGSGVMTVVEAMPASPDCMELDSFTAMRTGTLCG